MTYRLVVYPPGTNRAERRALQLWTSWPVVGAVLSLLAFAIAGEMLQPGLLVAMAALLYAGGIIAGWIASRRIRPLVKKLNVAQYPDNGRIRTLGDLATLSSAVTRLRSMDDRAASGELSGVEYEQEWWLVYSSLDSSTSLRAQKN